MSSPREPDAAPGSPTQGSVRLDVWLWAVRVYRTRALAQKACRGGHVKVDDETAKPATKLRVGDVVRARTGDAGRIERVLEVTELRTVRTGAALVAGAYVDHSPPPPPRLAMPALPVRAPGSGRPTKKERRELDRLRGRRG